MEKSENNKMKIILGLLAIIVPAAVALLIHFDSKSNVNEEIIPINEIIQETPSKQEIKQSIHTSKNTINNEGTIGTVIQNNSGSISIENNLNSKKDTINE